MAVPANFYVVDATPQANPIAGVAVGIYDPTTFAQVALGVTDAGGRASFLLPGSGAGQPYEARLFKMGFLFTNPQLIQVYEPEVPATPNGFQAVGTQVGVFGVPLDPRVCRVVGRFLNYQNQPVANGLVRFAQDVDLLKKTPKVIDGNAIMPSAMEVQTDQNGFVVVDLVRGGEFFVAFAGEDDETWNIKIPDRPTVNLLDLIHPYPVALTWSDPGPVFVTPGQLLLIDVTVMFSDYVSRAKELQDIVQFINSDETIIDLVYLAKTGQIGITGKAPGSAVVSAQPVADLFPRRVPDYALQSTALSVTVTP